MGVGLLTEVVSGNAGISLVLLVLVGALLWRERRRVRRLWRDGNPRWRVVGRLALAVQLLCYLWVSFFDYWRQLLGLLMTETTRYYSDPYVAAPISARHHVADPVRTVTLALLLAGALGLALLFYRHVGGPFLPLGTIVVGLLLYAVFSDARWRMNVWAANGLPLVGQGTTGDLLIDVAFFAWVVVVDAAAVLLEYLTLAALLALPIVVVGDFVARRLARPSPEYRQFTAALSARDAAARAERGRHEARGRGDQETRG